METIVAGLQDDKLSQMRAAFYSDPKNLLAQNVCTKQDPLEVCLRRTAIEENQPIFTHKLESEGKPVTNQRSSGRCWIFACLNVMRLPFAKAYNIDEFEFSQAHIFFWDKIERCNYFLHNIVDVIRRGEAVEGRLMGFLLHDPCPDGGQWDMLVNLIAKHGVMPKKCFPESYSCEQSARMNGILRSKLREYTRSLKEFVDRNDSDKEIENQINTMMTEIFRIVGICLSVPPEKFTWEYYNKTKQHNQVGPITPKDFYEEFVKTVFNIEEKVCLVTDPRPSNHYGKLYTVDSLGNMVNGRKTLYNNQPVELLMQLAAESIKNGEAVWFGCDVGKRFAGKQGMQDLQCHDFKLVFGVDVNTSLSKADRLIYGESQMTHAMVFTGVSLDKEGQPTKWRVENSWGDDKGEKGYLVMTSAWFKEFMYEVVIDKKYVPPNILEVLNTDPIVLPAWDPMGALAQCSPFVLSPSCRSKVSVAFEQSQSVPL